MDIRVKKLNEQAVIPGYAHLTDAGLDLTAVSKTYDEYGNVVYGTGLAFEIPEGYVGLVFPRSSNHRRSLIMINSVGVIDSGYRGEVTCKFRKDFRYIDGCTMMHDPEGEYNTGDRIAQIIIVPYPKIDFIEADELTCSDRGNGGYGSTGK